MEFPQALRASRTRRRLSQLELAGRAGTTQRHISFMESGRSAPGRTMVIRLAESLDLPLRERNGLLRSAGFAPAYPRTDLAAPALAPVREAIDRVLAGHLPYPAIVVDRSGELVAHNSGFAIFTDGVAPELLEPPVNTLRLALHPNGLAPRIVNFAEWSRHIWERVHQESAERPDARLSALDIELRRYLPEFEPGAEHLGFAVPLRLRAGPGELRPRSPRSPPRST